MRLPELVSRNSGSASLATDADGNVTAEMRYYPYGETRWSTGTLATDRRFTGQREETGLGLYDYVARRYDPRLGRFLQADTIVPELANPQSLNRFAYVKNNPLKYTDPTGHCADDDTACQTEADLLYAMYGWQVFGVWTLDDVKALLEAARRIFWFFRQNGRGDAAGRMREVFGEVGFHHQNKFWNNRAVAHVIGHDVYLGPGKGEVVVAVGAIDGVHPTLRVMER